MESKKVALVTGGGSGIGEAIAMNFAEQGYSVAIADVDEEGANNVVENITEKNGEAYFVKTDTSSPEDCKKVVADTIEKYGQLDIAINNAGIGGEQSATAQYDIESWDKVISVNLSGIFYGMKYQIEAMKDNKDGGVILNMASVLGQVGTPLSPAYVAAKHGVVGLTKSTALAYAKDGIRVNSIGPGYIQTPLLTENLEQDQLEQLESLHPMGRLGTPEEVANLVAWLTSDKASFVTGSYYNVDGGYLAQ